MEETLFIDGHVHVYPMFDLERMIRAGERNAVASQRGVENRDEAVKIWLLTERRDCSFFRNIRQAALKSFAVAETTEEEALTICSAATHEPLLYVLAGRQLITREGLEICALATLFSAPDRRLSAAEAIREIRQNGGVAAVNWAPGKWFGGRGRAVRRLFDEFSPCELLISDTTMRPTLWPTPRLAAAAERRGYRRLCGSDPLPFAGEEELAGSYGVLVRGEFDGQRPAASVRRLLESDAPLLACGQRSRTFSWIRRQYRIMREKTR